VGCNDVWRFQMGVQLHDGNWPQSIPRNPRNGEEPI